MSIDHEDIEIERYELDEAPRYQFRVTRRAFVQCVGTGLLITWGAGKASGQTPRGAGRRRSNPASRFHIGKDGIVTALTGKVEIGQGARTQISQAVAEELGVDISQVRLIMADTDLVPNDGGTFGSRTTPSTVPTVRKAAAGAREALIELACKGWGEDPASASIRGGVIEHKGGKRITLAELASSTSGVAEILSEYEAKKIDRIPQADWETLGQSILKIDGSKIVTGAHLYPSDIKRPGMLYGKILRPPTYKGELLSVDMDAVQDMPGVVAVHDGNFVGCTAPTTYRANEALQLLAATATWTDPPHPSSAELSKLLKENAGAGTGRRRSRDRETGDVDAALAAGEKVFRADYELPYVQHAPMETRAAVAEWTGDKLTVWTGGQVPFGVRGELARAFGLSQSNVRVIVPDTGGGFGGKHTGDAAVEAARLAKTAGKPVHLQWTREEEFTWAYFRPAALIEVAAALDAQGKVTAWDFTNYNSGGSALACPYNIPNIRTRFKQCDSPLREGSYRALASTANNFARECFIETLAKAAGQDPLDFRLAHLENERMRNVLIAAADKFGWKKRNKKSDSDIGFGISCGTEKGSYLATCAEVQVGRKLEIRRVVVAFECGAIQNPKNLQSQVEGSTIMGLGAVLREHVEFQDGKLLKTNFKQYEVPRFEDVPPIEIVLVDRPDLPSVGGSETPIICIAPSIANAVADATGKAVRSLPITMAGA